MRAHLSTSARIPLIPVELSHSHPFPPHPHHAQAASTDAISGSAGNRSTDERFDASSGDAVTEHRSHADTESGETDSRHNDEAHEAAGHAAAARGTQAGRTRQAQHDKHRKYENGE